MKKFAFMMIASMAMSMTVSLTSCHNENKISEGDTAPDSNLPTQVLDTIPTTQSADSVAASEAQSGNMPAETENTERAE